LNRIFESKSLAGPGSRGRQSVPRNPPRPLGKGERDPLGVPLPEEVLPPCPPEPRGGSKRPSDITPALPPFVFSVFQTTPAPPARACGPPPPGPWPRDPGPPPHKRPLEKMFPFPPNPEPESSPETRTGGSDQSKGAGKSKPWEKRGRPNNFLSSTKNPWNPFGGSPHFSGRNPDPLNLGPGVGGQALPRPKNPLSEKKKIPALRGVFFRPGPIRERSSFFSVSEKRKTGPENRQPKTYQSPRKNFRRAPGGSAKPLGPRGPRFFFVFVFFSKGSNERPAAPAKKKKALGPPPPAPPPNPRRRNPPPRPILRTEVFPPAKTTTVPKTGCVARKTGKSGKAPPPPPPQNPGAPLPGARRPAPFSSTSAPGPQKRNNPKNHRKDETAGTP